MEQKEFFNKKRLMISLISSHFLFFFIIFVCIMVVLGSIGNDSSDSSSINIDMSALNLPAFINQEMLSASFQVQQQYGYPVSVTIAQIIAESGFGKYDGLSGLAYNDKNLFGIKAGSSWTGQTVSYKTAEQTANGSSYTITATFRKYNSFTECIQDRAAILHRSYGVDGITDANEFAKKVASKWATSISYYNTLIGFMTKYNLYALDNLNINDANDYLSQTSAGNKTIVEKAKSKLGSQYQLGASHSSKAIKNPNTTKFDCSSFVCWVYYQSGKDIGVHDSRELNDIGKSVKYSELQPGDIIVYSSNKKASGIHHVAIYVGNGKIIHAKGKDYGVVEDSCTSGYYRKYIYSCRRI